LALDFRPLGKEETWTGLGKGPMEKKKRALGMGPRALEEKIRKYRV
jgi:hypothetical protein